ncbi:hypothetical protein H0H81_004432 [Sphagnurus paluster]|uniref:AB hydrolase-1 domain-containing protein n=1 Tax=Sphagnurus paluster TaxID=117069 RepID=A0A9P7K2G0_9AGAR|nr:hypothetical protein H0H81_004432 [Sphagnurus paluster]
MDDSLYKSLITSRDLKYSYYYSRPVAEKPVILFIHGFPNTANDWRYQVAFFKDQGYGIIAPDMLGYGGTDKPADYARYTLSAMSQDVIDILDAEKLEKVIAIGHDCPLTNSGIYKGSIFVSRIANYYPGRFIALAFLAVGYFPYSGETLEQIHASTKKLFGRQLFGYWDYFGEDDCHKSIEKNIDSFYSMVVPEDPKIWATHVTPAGALKAWVEANKNTTVASYLSEEEIKAHKEALLQGGLGGPLNWYKVQTSGLDIEDGKNLTPEQKLVHQPVFFAATTRDEICIPAMGKASCAHFVKGPVKVKEFDTGHWVMW